MAVQTPDLDKLLNPNFVEIEILNKLSPSLRWMDLFPPTQNDVGQFKRMNAAASASDNAEDGVIGQPLELGPLSELDTLDITTIDYSIGKLAVYGYSIQYKKTDTKQGDFADDLFRGYNQATYNLLDKTNSIVGEEVINNSRKSNADIKGDWNSVDATIPDDITLLEKEMKIPGKPFRMDTMLLCGDAFYGLKNYAETNPYSNCKINLDEIERNGIKYRNFEETLLDGYGSSMDSRFPPISTFKNVDPEFSNARRVEIELATNPQNNSNQETETFPPSLVNIDMYRQQEFPKKNVIEIWMEFGAGMKESEASMLSTGL